MVSVNSKMGSPGFLCGLGGGQADNGRVDVGKTVKKKRVNKRNNKCSSGTLHQLNVRVEESLYQEFRAIVKSRSCTDRVVMEEAIKLIAKRHRRKASKMKSNNASIIPGANASKK